MIRNKKRNTKEIWKKGGESKMPIRKTMTFQEVLDIIELLSESQRESLIDIVQHRLIEQRREKLVQNIKEARCEYARGEIRKGTVEDLMKELSE